MSHGVKAVGAGLARRIDHFCSALLSVEPDGVRSFLSFHALVYLDLMFDHLAAFDVASRREVRTRSARSIPQRGQRGFGYR